VPQDLGTYPNGAVETAVPCCNTINDHGQIVGFSVDASGNLTALLWQSENAAPVDLNSLLPADSPWFLLAPGGISNAGQIATTAFNMNTSEVHAVLLTPIHGIGPAARGATKQPALPEGVRKLFQKGSFH
jgi:probable HAF family extracellular repeat protein